MQIVVQANGSLRCLYGEELDLHSLGRLKIARGSHVEPTVDGQWTADMFPLNGPIFGPFQNRSAALVAERQWLEQHWLSSSQVSLTQIGVTHAESVSCVE